MKRSLMLASTVLAGIALGGLTMSTTAFAATSSSGNQTQSQSQYQNQNQNQTTYRPGPVAGPGLAYSFGYGPMAYGWGYGPGYRWGYGPGYGPGYCPGLGLSSSWGSGYGSAYPGYNYGEWDYSLVETLTPAEAASAVSSALTNATINTTANTIVYAGQKVTIVALAAPTGKENKFVIGGLSNPTITVEKGATVTMRLINEDPNLPHGSAVTTAPPPYESVGLFTQTGIYPGSLIRPLPMALENAYPTDVAVFTASKAGTFYYVCQVPAHAENGMYGKIIVK